MLYQSFLIAFAMYSKIPVPNVPWNDRNMKYAISFFPMVGLFLGVLFNCLYWIMNLLELPKQFSGAILTVLPVLVTGGIHMDGYCDTMDAKASCQPIKRRHEILKDPHIGAFALIYLGTYYLLFYAGACLLNQKLSLLFGICFIISRSLSGLSVLYFPTAKTTGTVTSFSQNSSQRACSFLLFSYLLICFLIILWMDWIYGILVSVLAVIGIIHYYRLAIHQFHGTCGDLAGYFLCRLELSFLLGIVILERVKLYGLDHWW